ncbi:MAG: KpsF/GutQ family sugar-phosphate isomerase [Candidatus Tectomicrobia bacterium]|nr:KpsF/GutQ family sugar-phosphate isomerase [Candidatus Tectomicrobia bacterium]
MVLRRARMVLEIESNAIAALISRLDSSFERAVTMLLELRGRLILTGIGKSGIIAQKIAATFTSVGTPAHFLHPVEGLHGDVGILSRTDLAMAVSRSGETDELLRLLPIFKRFGVPIIALNGNPSSSLARHSDVVLDVAVAAEACPLGLVPTASTTAALAMGDALAMAVLEQRHFSREDFALLHPGGSLGNRLTLTVRDLMHTGDAIPRVADDASFKEIILEISSKKLGHACVLDRSGRLLGIITDGDLRRLFEKTENVFSMRARDFMTVDPKVIGADELAAKAVQIMEAHSITALVVIDEAKSVQGFLHLHSVLAAGVV